MSYKPKDYWDKRLSKNFNLTGVGHIDFSQNYNKWLYRAKVRALKKALLSNGITTEGKTVCDIGCGTGFFVDFYRHNKAKDIVGVDITSVSTDRLGSLYPWYKFFTENISSELLLPKINRTFDILNVFDVLYHIKDDNLFKMAVSNIANLTKKNGFILISDSLASKDANIAHHVKFRCKNNYE